MDIEKSEEIEKSENESAEKIARVSESGDVPWSSDNPFEIGSVLEGKYRIEAVIGRGGMGAVYRANQLLLNIDVALKTLDADWRSNATAVRRFQTEARAAFSLRHRNLVDVHDFGLLESGHPFLVMELIDGTSLQDILKKQGTMEIDDAVAMLVQLCHGLGFAHQNSIVHRDVKPGNIMILNGKDLKSEVAVKILDFGIAKVVNTLDVDAEALTKTGDLFGSPLYMSPEQCSGGLVDKRSDIYSLGCVFFEALTGTPPFVGPNPLRTMMLHQNDKAPTLRHASMGRDYPVYLERVVARMLAKDVRERYQDLNDVSREILSNMHGKAVADQSKFPNLLPVNATESNTIDGRPLNAGRLSVTWLQLCLFAVPIVGISLAAGFWFSAENARTQQPKAEAPKREKWDGHQFGSLEKLSSEGTKYFNLSFQQAKTRFIQHDGPIFLKTVLKDGLKQRQLNFPSMSIGKVCVYSPDRSTMLSEIDAVNDARVPIGSKLAFRLDATLHPEVAMNSFVFDKISANIFSGLYIYGQQGSSVLSIVTDDQVDSLLPGIEHLLQDAVSWTDLTEVLLSFTRISEDVGASLDSMPKLNHLSLKGCHLDKPNVLQPEMMKRLKYFEVSDAPVATIFQGLAGSRNLEMLVIGDKCKGLTAQALDPLKSCSKLKSIHVDFDGAIADPLVLEALTKLKSVRLLELPTAIGSHYDGQKFLTAAGFKAIRSNVSDYTNYVR